MQRLGRSPVPEQPVRAEQGECFRRHHSPVLPVVTAGATSIPFHGAPGLWAPSSPGIRNVLVRAIAPTSGVPAEAVPQHLTPGALLCLRRSRAQEGPFGAARRELHRPLGRVRMDEGRAAESGRRFIPPALSSLNPGHCCLGLRMTSISVTLSTMSSQAYIGSVASGRSSGH